MNGFSQNTSSTSPQNFEEQDNFPEPVAPAAAPLPSFPSYSVPNMRTDVIVPSMRQASSLPHSASRRTRINLKRPLTERERFLVFIKILFQCISSSEDHFLRMRAKAIVTECTRRNRNGEQGYTPLQTVVESRLRYTVGELYWARAKTCFDQYCYQKGLDIRITAVAPV